MMRWLWFFFVNGHPVLIVWFAAWTLIYLFVLDLVGWAVPYAVLMLLNYASWDYQRRHRSQS